MGCYSWKDCITREPIKLGRCRNVYVLVPKEFGGGHIVEPCYQGYGEFGSRDIYELVATWNQKYLENFVFENPPKFENVLGMYEFEKASLREQGLSEEEIAKRELRQRIHWHALAVKRYWRDRHRIEYFREGYSKEFLEEVFGSEEELHDTHLRLIGIDIACGDEKNRRLKYPIKMTYDPNAVYEDCKYSKRDPMQGCD